jgi:hypothetical protein
MTSARLPDEIEEKLDVYSKVENMSKSQIIKEALTCYFVQKESAKDSYELGEPYFGKYGSGDGSLSRDYKSRLRDKIHAQRHTH